VVGGAVIAKNKELHEQLAWWANALGLTGSPFDSYLTLRGLRTLDARLAVHGRNSVELASWLATQPGIRKVYYPGLPDHPGHEVARRQQSGFGAIITIELEGGAGAVKRFVDGMAYFSLAESLGGVESLVAHPGTMTHAAMTPEARAAAGLVDGLLRLSVGIEDVADLKSDLAQALQRAPG
jgi:cystathionine gamma-synthase